ncbi:tetratricopeptide (TPR) repeat protein [Pedobacter cryoconitis]|uniref:Tetratricopeptide (TPR) repeat protein n=1 Tax=Pedobacter cryoconitis TaxID=188932 RepID=A0A7W9E2M3_9SPHI|nr:hypothetical protein [Pedobacter cryoconitis]MBB5638950.1 tetratricopeptide (TPR) repeat protein [Pedobacter cryoconitis]
MKKTLLLNLLIIYGVSSSFAQNQNVKDLYFDYTQTRMDDSKNPATTETALSLLNRSSELNEKQIANISFHLGRIYEAAGSPEKAIPLYENVIRLVPGYYVTYRALGYINLKKCNVLGQKVAESAKLKDAVLNNESYKAYKIQVLKTIALFEKSEACEADERTHDILATLYKSIKDTTSLASLPARLNVLGKDCISLLEDE